MHKLSANRDIERARRDMMSRTADGLAHDVTEILNSSLKYHTSFRNTEAERSIKMGLQDISARTALLSEVCKNDAELIMCRSAILALRKSITGVHFEDEHTEPIAEEDDQVQAITSDSLRLRNCFLRLKLRQFPVK